MNKLRNILPLKYFITKLVTLLYPWQNVKIPVAKCKYTREEPVAKCKIGPQCQNVAGKGNFSMLWAWQNGGEKEKKEEKKEGKKKEKRRGKERKDCIYRSSYANTQFILYVIQTFNMVNKLY